MKHVFVLRALPFQSDQNIHHSPRTNLLLVRDIVANAPFSSEMPVLPGPQKRERDITSIPRLSVVCSFACGSRLKPALFQTLSQFFYIGAGSSCMLLRLTNTLLWNSSRPFGHIDGHKGTSLALFTKTKLSHVMERYLGSFRQLLP